MELKIKDAVADSGAQITIVPASLLDQSGIKITSLRQSKVHLRAPNNGQIDVQGVADATISALLPSGERFKTSSKIYIVRNVSEVYFSLDVLVGLRIVNEFFPAARAGNQHGCAHCAAAAASLSSCECLPRMPPPEVPAHLPMAPSPSNVPEMRAWLLD